MTDDIDIRIIRQAPEKDLERLYAQASWIDPETEDYDEFLKTVVKSSALFAGAFQGERLIGMGRALSDLCSDAYIQDIAVLEPYRKNGIGKKIVELLIRELKKEGVEWIGLVAEPGTQPFYARIGFEPLQGYIPLKYKEK